jgi:hypothetical protein
VKRRILHKPVALAICGEHSGLSEFIVKLFRTVVGVSREIILIEYRFADHLIAAAGEQTFDVLVVFLNSTLFYSETRKLEWSPNDFETLRDLKRICGKPLIVIHNELAGYTNEGIVQTGADAVFGMPFRASDFVGKLRQIRCRNS